MFKKILILGAFLIAGIIAGTFLHLTREWERPGPAQQDILLEISKGMGPQTIALKLQTLGIIRSPRSFTLYVRAKGLAPQLKAGWYLFPREASIAQCAKIIAEGKSATHKITIPEGRASWEIYSILRQAYPNLDSLRWDSLVHNAAFATSLGIDGPTLEGWLFPDTHSLPMGADEQQLLRLLVQSTWNVLHEFEGRPGSMKDRLGGWRQVLTMASVVEEETGLPEERPRVSGVFHNRLRMGMPLGADPTVRFIFRNLTGPIYKSQLDSNSPYNTRKFVGLPPGPISNPGKAAIEAALFPMQTKDLYFVAKDDGTPGHFFGQSLREHNQYKEQAAKNRAERARKGE